MVISDCAIVQGKGAISEHQNTSGLVKTKVSPYRTIIQSQASIGKDTSSGNLPYKRTILGYYTVV
jgi:hypothetical protein